MEKGVETEESMLIYFDGSHPTGAVNIHVADKAFASSNKDEAQPININQLAAA